MMGRAIEIEHAREDVRALWDNMVRLIKSIEGALGEAPDDADIQMNNMEAALINLATNPACARGRRRVKRNFRKKHPTPCPAMPTARPLTQEHRPLASRLMLPATLARPAPRTEMMANEAAKKATRAESGKARGTSKMPGGGGSSPRWPDMLERTCALLGYSASASRTFRTLRWLAR